MICLVENCNKEVKYKGMCGMHYKRLWRHGSVSTCVVPNRLEETKCSVADCVNLIGHSCGLCTMHKQRFDRYGRLHNINAEKGSGGLDTNGYYVLTIEGRRVYEHVYRAEQALGKRLPKGAVVHHMNGELHDNDTPFNLIICPDQAYHLLLHRRAKELGYENS